MHLKTSDNASFCWSHMGKDRPECPIQASINLCLGLDTVFQRLVQGVDCAASIGVMLFHLKPAMMRLFFQRVFATLQIPCTLQLTHLYNVNLLSSGSYADIGHQEAPEK